MQVDICNSLTDVNVSDWDSLGDPDYPFTRHAFLHGLEKFDCLEPFGWSPVYFLIRDKANLLAALPCYIKNNSYGELVFDHAWAQAYQQSGIEYYPKLVSAIPYTPATGERFLINQSLVSDPESRELIRHQLCRAAITFCENHNLSSWHILFPEFSILKSLESLNIMPRCDIQFHWQNHGYADFDAFLATLSSRKRKNIRKERQVAQHHGFDIRMHEGCELSENDWSKVHELYASIYNRKYGTATLSRDFFQHLGKALNDRVLVVLARDQGRIIAVSLFFRSDSHLYGRVWGCEGYAHNLHFECCYYQGIDYCIENRLDWFDPGAQGEHKLSRGFLPTKTWSGHWIGQSQFREAIANFLKQERRHIDLYQSQLMQHSPYRKC